MKSRRSLLFITAAGVGAILAVLAGLPPTGPTLPVAAQDGWLPTLEEGRSEAADAGRAILLVTMWKTGV